MKLVTESVRKATVTTDLSGIEQFLDQYNTRHIKELLISFPSRIMELKDLIRQEKDAFKEADQPRQMLELEIIDNIAAETNQATGKAMFSNDKARENELARRKAHSPEYQELRIRSREAGRNLAAAEDELERLVNKFKAYRYVAALVTAELSVIAGSLAEEWPTEEVNALNNGVGGAGPNKDKNPY